MSVPSSSLFFETSLFESMGPNEPQHQQAYQGRSSSFVLGESVFDKFTSHAIKEEYTLPLIDDAVGEAAPTTSPIATMGTVSPLEIHSSLIGSVFDDAELDSTPMFEELDVDESKNWVSLFGDSEMAAEEQVEEEQTFVKAEVSERISTMKRSHQEVEQQMITPSATPLLDGHASKRSKSDSSATAIDHLGVVSYNRKQRSAPLSPILADDGDPVAAKRARNTEAARRSRARKMERMSQLEDKVDGLLKRNSELEDEVARLRAMLGK